MSWKEDGFNEKGCGQAILFLFMLIGVFAVTQEMGWVVTAIAFITVTHFFAKYIDDSDKKN